MSIKSAADLDGLRRAGSIVAACLRAMRRRVRPGITTAKINAHGAHELHRHGGRSAPMLVYGFPAEFCISVNDEIVHGIPSDRVLLDGDLLKLDVTVEMDGYMADAAVTVAVGGVAPEKQAMIDCARRALAHALASARAGSRVRDIGAAVQGEVERSGLTVVRELTGHGIGRTIHERPAVPNFDDPRATQQLTVGLVLAVEPIISAGSGDIVQSDDGWTLRTTDGSASSHYEHTIVITAGLPLVLTAPAGHGVSSSP